MWILLPILLLIKLRLAKEDTLIAIIKTSTLIKFSSSQIFIIEERNQLGQLADKLILINLMMLHRLKIYKEEILAEEKLSLLQPTPQKCRMAYLRLKKLLIQIINSIKEQLVLTILILNLKIITNRLNKNIIHLTVLT